MTESVSFDRAAEYYDQTRAIPDETVARLLQMIVAEVGVRSACIEIGVGTGRIALPLVEAGVRVVGVDISKEMLRKLVAKRAAGSWPQIAIADATRLPFPDRSFDAALAVHVMHLIPAWREAAAEMVRVLRPGGVFLVSRGGQRRSGWIRDVSRHFYAEAGNVNWPPGVGEITDLDAHMRGLGAAVRELPDMGEEDAMSIDRLLANLEAGYWSACWSIDPDTRRQAAARTRLWAEREIGDPAIERPAREFEVWRAYRLAQ